VSALAAGFARPVESAQRCFRAVMDAMASPGTVAQIADDVAAPAPLAAASAAIALTLADYETPVWLDQRLAEAPAVARWLRFHTGAEVTADPRQAALAFVADPAGMPPGEAFAIGTSEYPDRSTTIALQLQTLTEGQPMRLAGPGIKGVRSFAPAPLPTVVAEILAANRALFPRGIDLLLVANDAVAALPRSVRIVQGD
jgi:alpha-D-ribose 1-methylphosphonate 5-triphosphate synthase subunit PhnH